MKRRRPAPLCPRRAAWCAALGFLGALLVSTVARSDPPAAAPSPAPPAAGSVGANRAVDPAEAAARQAAALYEQGDYVGAAQELQRAYELEPRPLFLFNVGQAYRKAMRPREAVDAYQRFIDAAPAHPLVPEARGYQADMKLLILQEERAELAKQTLLLDQQRAEEALAAERRRAEEQEAQLQRQLQAARKVKPLYKRPWFWAVLGGVTASAVIVGLTVGLTVGRPALPTAEGGFQDVHF